MNLLRYEALEQGHLLLRVLTSVTANASRRRRPVQAGITNDIRHLTVPYRPRRTGQGHTVSNPIGCFNGRSYNFTIELRNATCGTWDRKRRILSSKRGLGFQENDNLWLIGRKYFLHLIVGKYLRPVKTNDLDPDVSVCDTKTSHTVYLKSDSVLQFGHRVAGSSHFFLKGQSNSNSQQ